MEKIQPVHVSRKLSLKAVALTSFFLILLILIGYSFFGGDVDLAGNIVGTPGNEKPDKILFDAQLSVPEIEIDGSVEILNLRGSGSLIEVGDQEFDLSEIKGNYIVLGNFVGELIFNESEVSSISGRASSIKINGIDVSKSGENLRVELSGFGIDSLSIPTNVSIKKIDYVGSGEVVLNSGKTELKLEEENILFEGFVGSVSVQDGLAVFEGGVSKFQAQGDSNLNIEI